MLARIEGIDRALAVIRRRRGKAYDPALTDVVLDQAARWWDEVEPADPWDAALAVAPRSEPLRDAELHESLLVLADFSDLKSPWLGGHSCRRCPRPRCCGGPWAEAAALVHDLGRVAVPNTVWDKPAGLTRDERDRAESHTLVTDQLLPAAVHRGLADVACGAHERMDGSATTGASAARTSTTHSVSWPPPTATRP